MRLGLCISLLLQNIEVRAMKSKKLIGCEKNSLPALRRLVTSFHSNHFLHFLHVQRMKFASDHRIDFARFYALVELLNGARDKDIHRGLGLSAVFLDTAPSYLTVSLWCKQFPQHFTMFWSDMPRPGQPRTSCTPENCDKIRALLEQNLKYSCRALEEDLGLSKQTVLKILTFDLYGYGTA